MKRWLTPARALKSVLMNWNDEYRARRAITNARHLSRIRRSSKHGMVFTAAGVGSLGDEAMLVAAGDVLHESGIPRLTIVSYGSGAGWEPLGAFSNVLPFGIRYHTDFWGTCRELTAAFREVTHFLVLGADVMDGYYNYYEAIRRVVYARIARAAGINTAIGSFSFNATPHPRSVAALTTLTDDIALIARDPVSRQRLQRSIDHPVELGADIAFLLEPAKESPVLAALLPWLSAERNKGRLLVGVNANYLVLPQHRQGDVGESLVSAFVSGLEEFCLAHGRVSLVLIPHDYRRMAGRYDDLQLLRMILDRLPFEVAGNVRLVDQRLRAAEAKAIAGELDFVLSGRMHLVIAALGMGVPAAGISYQGKFEGLWKHFQLKDASLSPEELLKPGALAAFLRQCVSRREAMAAAISDSLPRVRDLARVNFSSLCPEIRRDV